MVRVAAVVAFLALLAPAAHAQQPGGAEAFQDEPGRYVVFFALDSAALDAEAREVVQAAADEFQRTGAARVEVRGHTDTAGSADYNQALSERRADAVAQELILLGVPSAAITRTGLGETELLVPTGDGVREPRNRRAEIDIERPVTPPTPAQPPPPVVEPPPVAAVPPPEPEPEPRRRALFSLGALYGFNLQDEGSDDNDGTSHLAGANLSFDYAVFDWVSLSLEQAGFYHFMSGDNGFGGRSAAGLNFFPGLGDVIPYVGGNIGYIYGSGIDNDFFAGPEVGLNLGPFNAKVAYDMPFGRSFGNGIIVTTVGLGLRF
jgi:hypothetical protein